MTVEVIYGEIEGEPTGTSLNRRGGNPREGIESCLVKLIPCLPNNRIQRLDAICPWPVVLMELNYSNQGHARGDRQRDRNQFCAVDQSSVLQHVQ